MHFKFVQNICIRYTLLFFSDTILDINSKKYFYLLVKMFKKFKKKCKMFNFTIMKKEIKIKN